MRKHVVGAVVVGLLQCGSAIADTSAPASVPDEITATITSMFEAAANGDVYRFRQCLAPGFQVYENGGTMTGDQVYALVRTVFDHDGRLEWSVTEPRGRVDGDLAAIQYVNQGSMTRGGVRQPVTWLETAALHRVDGRWRIMFMQSQRTKDTAMVGKR